MKNNVRRLAYAVLGSLVALCLYLGLIPFYIDKVTGGGKGPVDPRLYAREKMIKRGDILDRHGNILARSVPVENGYAREYPMGSAAAHITGYRSERYGAAGLEKTQARVLLGLEGGNRLDELLNRVLNRHGAGNDVVLTMDAGLQEYAYRLLRGRKGAVAVLNPTSGQVLALATNPSYNPAQVGEYMGQPDAPLLNRAVQGAYPPGSVFKIVTGAAVLAKQPATAVQRVQCTGSLQVNGFQLRDNAVHGTVDFNAAFARSCNVAFGGYGLSLGAQTFYQQAQSFGITREFAFPLPVYPGNITPPGDMTAPELASSAIGQGEVLISPLQAAMLAGAVANQGVIMKPYLVSAYINKEGDTTRFYPRKWLQAMEPTEAAALKEMMVSVVREGTGKAAAVAGVRVAGKTGSAENPHGKTHAWFVGFAPAEQPRVAVAVLLENAGAGGANAAPLAGDIIGRALQ